MPPETNHHYDGQPCTTDVRGCARCGGEHDDVEFLPITRPVLLENGSIDMTHYAPCPTNGEPILMRWLEDDPPTS